METGPTSHAISKYAPGPLDSRKGLALCLSGGGFRASLFHLGALRRLNELGILSRVTTISSVSGGSILAAHLATRFPSWPTPGEALPTVEWDNKFAAPFHEFTSRNLRTGPILRRLIPWNWFRSSTGVNALASAYADRLTPLMLSGLPARPRYVLCATDMAFGVNWVFEKSRMGDYQLGYCAPPADWPLARAVAASSCFPPVFNPLPMELSLEDMKGGAATKSERLACLEDLRLTDGGNYDNLGLEPVWKDHATVLVSNGGATFDFGADKNLIWRLSRYQAIQGRQAEAIRVRWLISSFIVRALQGTYWGIGTTTGKYGPQAPEGYAEDIVDDLISEIRTDLDAFSDGERYVLENHGYLLADSAARRYVPSLIAIDAPLRAPHRRWMDEQRVREALKRSHKRKLPFGR